jgi:serine/threonine-protein kinase RsbW
LSDVKDKILISSSTKNLARVRDFIESKANEYGFDDDEINQIVLSVDEACTNIIKHAHKFDDNESIEIKVERANGEFKVVLKYNGTAFDPNNLNDPNMAEYFSKFRIGGLGIPIMKKFMNKIIFNHRNPNHNSLTLIKTL